MPFSIRFAQPEDVSTLLTLIREMAAYEEMSNEVTATEDILKKSLFEERSAEALIAEEDGEVVGYAVMFTNFSTFTGKKGMYLEDICPFFRKKGYGKKAVCPGSTDSAGTRLRTDGMVLPGLEYPFHQLLPQNRRRSHGGMDRIPDDPVQAEKAERNRTVRIKQNPCLLKIHQARVLLTLSKGNYLVPNNLSPASPKPGRI